MFITVTMMIMYDYVLMVCRMEADVVDEGPVDEHVDDFVRPLKGETLSAKFADTDAGDEDAEYEGVYGDQKDEEEEEEVMEPEDSMDVAGKDPLLSTRTATRFPSGSDIRIDRIDHTNVPSFHCYVVSSSVRLLLNYSVEFCWIDTLLRRFNAVRGNYNLK